MNPVSISNLQAHPEWLATVSEWLHKEWMGRYGEGVSQASVDIDRRARMESLRKHLSGDSVPVSFVAHSEGQPIGIVSLVRYQSEQSPQPAVWLTNLFVVHRFRAHGVGQSLLLSAQTYARDLNPTEFGNASPPSGRRRIYLFTHDLTEYYRARGWSSVRSSVLHGVRGDIMRLDLD